MNELEEEQQDKQMPVRLKRQHIKAIEMIQSVHKIKTANKAIQYSLDMHFQLKAEVRESDIKIKELERVIAGLSTGADAMRAVLNILDQKNMDF